VEILVAIGVLATLGIAAYFFGYDSRHMGRSASRGDPVRF